MLIKYKDKLAVRLWNYLNSYIDDNLREQKLWGNRSKIVDFYCKGKGIEIGASCYPIHIYNSKIDIKYLDHIDRNKTKDMKSVQGLPYVNVDIIDDAEKLIKVKDRSLNFIIMCHMLEHAKNPIGVIENCLAKLKCGGVLIISIPDKWTIFDKNRPLTSWEHLLEDSMGINDEKDFQHMVEYLTLAEGYTDELAFEEAKKRIEADYRPHYHVWDSNTFYSFLIKTNEVSTRKYRIMHYSINKLDSGRNGREMIAVLEKI